MAIYRGPGGANDGIPSSSSTEFPGDVNVSGNLHVNGDITSDGNIDGVHTGDGSGLTNLPIPEFPDVYTKTEIDAQQTAQDEAIQDVEDALDLIPAPIDSYTKDETNTLLDNKADKSNTYTKAETYNNTEIDGKLFEKADKTDTYTKTEVDDKVAGSGGGIPEAPVDGKQYARKDADWSEVEASGTGGGASAGGVIYENGVTILSDYTLSTNKNGMSVGPITIDSGATVTVPSGQRWVIL